jgi:hypothetical protein
MADIKVKSDSGKFKAGADSDLEVYSDGSNSYIKNTVNDQTIILSTKTGGTNTSGITLDGSNNVTLLGNIIMGDDTSIGISDSDERIEFDASGDISVLGANFGIGTNAPANESSGTLLHIADTGNSNAAHINMSGGDGNDGSQTGKITFSDPGTTNDGVAFISANIEGGGDHPGGNLHFFTSTTGSGAGNNTVAEKMVITGAGNVGIGQAASEGPESLLHVRGQSDGALLDVFRIDNDHGSTNTEAGILFETGQLSMARISALNQGSDLGELRFWTSGSSNSPSERMRIDKDGQVGIGVTDPTALLHILDWGFDDDDGQVGFKVEQKKEGGGSNAADDYYGIYQNFEFDGSSDYFGVLKGIHNQSYLNSSGEATTLTGIYSRAIMDAGADVNNVYGTYTHTDIDGGTVDSNVYGALIDVDLETAATVSGNTHAIQIDLDDDAGDNDTKGIYLNLLSGVQWGIYQDEGSSRTFSVSGGGTIAAGNTTVQSIDYAEYFESKNGKAIAIGKTVKLDNGKIVPCEDGDTPIGVVRPKDAPGITLGEATFGWNQKFEKDDYDAQIMESYTRTKWTEEITEEEYHLRGKDKTGGSLGGSVKDEKIEGSDDNPPTYIRQHKYHSDRIPEGLTPPNDAVVYAIADKRKKLNPDYDASKESGYKSRAERDEWCLVGLLGQIPITKGQPTSSNWIKMKDVSDTVEMWFVK